MTNFGRYNARRRKQINNGEPYIILEISLELGISERREVASLGPKYHVGQSGIGLTNSLTLKTRMISNNKKKTRNVNPEYAYQYIMRITEEFKITPSQNFK